MRSLSTHLKHYHILLFDEVDLKDLTDRLNNNFNNFDRELFIENEYSLIYESHISRNIAYGSPNVMSDYKIKGEEGEAVFLYNLFYGTVHINPTKSLSFLCCPYIDLFSKLRRFIDNEFFDQEIYFTSVNTLLEYIKNSSLKHYKLTSGETLKYNIVKYTAQIMDNANADQISISGINPLNSTVLSFLEDNPKIDLVPNSLKFLCTFENNQKISLLINRHGRYRIWIPKNATKEIFSVLGKLMTFIDEVNKSY